MARAPIVGPAALDAYAIRCALRAPLSRWMPPTQAEFAGWLGVSVATVRDWEQGRRRPDAAARTLLALIATAPAETVALLSKIAEDRTR